MDLFVELFWYQLPCFCLQLCHFLFFIPNLLFLCYLSYFYLFFLFFFYPLQCKALYYESSFFFLLSLPISFPLLSSSLPPSAFAILNFPILVSTTFHILLGTSSSLPLLFSNQSQDCSKLATAFPRSCSTYSLQLHLFLSSLYVLDNEYLLLLYFL